jgi:hypothetical protein
VERAIQIFAAVNFLVIGLSHAFQSRVWVDFFVWLRGKGHVGVFLNGFLSLSFGAIVVSFHNVWTGLPVILTVIGWMQVAKGLLSFVVPRWGMRSLERVSPERAGEFVAAGVVFLVLSALTGYLALASRVG